jgi:hypothetical protein
MAETITIRTDEETEHALDVLTGEGISRSAAIRQAVIHAAERRERAVQLRRSAAVVKLVHAEPETPALRAWLDERAESGWASSVLVEIESFRALARYAPKAGYPAASRARRDRPDRPEPSRPHPGPDHQAGHSPLR